MTLTFKADIPRPFNPDEKNSFLTLLIQQGQVENPNLSKINSCPLLYMTYLDNIPVAIGAIKNVYKMSFTKAKVSELQNDYNDELDSIYVTDNKNLNVRGLGIATTLCRLFLKNFDKAKALQPHKIMMPIICFGFYQNLVSEKVGKTYQGNKTKKNISLFVKG